MQDDFMDYLDDYGTASPTCDQNSVLLAQAILSVLQRRMVYPELMRFAVDTLAGMASPQGDSRTDADLADAIKLAQRLKADQVRQSLGKRDTKVPKDKWPRLIALLERYVGDGRASGRMEVVRSNINTLCEMFKLGNAEARVLFAALICKSHAAYDTFADGLLQRSKSLAPMLACLLGLDEDESAQICKSTSPLAEAGLVTFDASKRVFMSAVGVPYSVSCVLQGAHDTAEAMRTALLGPCVTGTLTLDDFPHLAPTLATLVRVVSGAIRDKAMGVNILLHGRPGTGKTQLAMALAAAAGAQLLAVGEKYDDGREPDRDERLGALLMTQKMLGADASEICLFDEMEDLFARPDSLGISTAGSKVFLNRLLETNRHPVIWIANDLETIPVWLRRRMVFGLQVDHPPAEVQERILTRILRDRDLHLTQSDIADLARMEGIAPGVARNAIYGARLANGGVAEVRAGLDGLARAVTGSPLVLRKVDGATAFDPDLSVADLDLLALADGFVASQDRAFSMCLYGAPGTGKSAYARHLAERLGMKVLQKRGADLFGPYVGQTEQAIASAFAEARDQEAFLIFDEADSLLFDRATATRRFEVTQVAEMLTWMESHPLPFACTTNLMDRLDPASLRRFTFKVKFDYLGLRQSRACFQRILGREAPMGLGRLTRLTPADFHVVAKKARVLGQFDDSDRLLDMLGKESAAKGEVANPIGFRFGTEVDMQEARAG